MSIFKANKTSAALRLMADKIDRDEDVDFLVVLYDYDDEMLSSAHRCNTSPFLIMGVAQHRCDMISQEEMDE